MNRLDTNDAIYQQDNATINTSKFTKDWFKTKNIKVLDWPTKSLFLNLIENLSRNKGILSRSVHKDRKALKSCIKQYWNENFLIQCKTSVLKYYKGNKCKY